MAVNKEENIDTKKNKSEILKLRQRIYAFGDILIYLIIALFFGLLFYNIRDSLSPIVVFVMLIIILAQFWKYSWAKTIIAISFIFFMMWVMRKSGYLIVPFIIGIFVAYLFDPLISRLSGKFPRFIVSILIFLPLLIFSVLFIIFVFPAIARETQRFIMFLPSYTIKIMDGIIVFSEKMDAYLKTLFSNTVKINLAIDRSTITDFLFARASFLSKFFNIFSQMKTPNITKIGSMLFSYFIIMPLVTFYFMVDFPNVKARGLKLMPMRWQNSVDEIIKNSSKLINDYIRGMLILSLCIGVAFFIMLVIGGVRYALLLAFIRCVFNVVPFVGPFAAFIIALFVGTATEGVWWHGFLKVCIIYGVGQVLDTGILAPNIIGDNMKMGPITVMFATIIGGAMFGFLGILIAVPLAGVLALILRKFLSRYYRSAFYNFKGK